MRAVGKLFSLKFAARYKRVYFTTKMAKKLSDDEWRVKLNKEQFRILREKGTEPAGSGQYNKHTDDGVYTCAACDTPLYSCKHKFDSGCGWPAFFDAIPGAIKVLYRIKRRLVRVHHR